MTEPRQNEYGRADKAAVWMLLSRLYLNAEVYIQTPKYDECMKYARNVISAVMIYVPTMQNFSWLTTVKIQMHVKR